MQIDPQYLPIIAVRPTQAAKLLGIDARHIALAVRTRALPAHQCGKAVLVTLRQLEAWVESLPHPKLRARKQKDEANAD